MGKDVCWIETIGYDQADDDLKAVYDQVRGPDGCLDALYKPYGLRPHMLGPADALYRATLHNDGNSLPKWLLELVGTYVAILTGCDYAAVHHGQNFKVLFGDPVGAEHILDALRDDRAEDELEQKERTIMHYVAKLTRSPEKIREEDLGAMRRCGLSDGEILEVNQVAASFNYWARVINGLGIRLGDEPVGRYP